MVGSAVTTVAAAADMLKAIFLPRSSRGTRVRNCCWKHKCWCSLYLAWNRCLYLVRNFPSLGARNNFLLDFLQYCISIDCYVILEISFTLLIFWLPSLYCNIFLHHPLSLVYKNMYVLSFNLPWLFILDHQPLEGGCSDPVFISSFNPSA